MASNHPLALDVAGPERGEGEAPPLWGPPGLRTASQSWGPGKCGWLSPRLHSALGNVPGHWAWGVWGGGLEATKPQGNTHGLVFKRQDLAIISNRITAIKNPSPWEIGTDIYTVLYTK